MIADRKLAVAEDLHQVGVLDQAALHQGIRVHVGAGLEILFQRGDVDPLVGHAEAVVGEAALGDAPQQRQLAALEPVRLGAARGGVLTLLAAGGRLAVPGTRAGAEALALDQAVAMALERNKDIAMARVYQAARSPRS